MEEVYYIIENAPLNIGFWWIVGPIVAIVSAYFAGKLAKVDDNIISIAIIGPQASGKTTLWDFFRKVEPGSDHKTATPKDTIEQFKTTIGDREYTVKKTFDIGGGRNFIKHYKEIIQDDTYVFFIFNAKDVIDRNEREILEIQSRLYYFKEEIKNSKQFQVIGSHLDKLSPRHQKNLHRTENEIISIIGEKYFDMVPSKQIEEHFKLLNLTDWKMISPYINEIFTK